MQCLDKKPKKINVKEFRHRRADDADCSSLITEDTVILKDGVPVIVYIKNAAGNTSAAFKALQSIKYQRDRRTSGLVTESRIFGYSPRNGPRNAPCRATVMNREYPEQYQLLESLAEGASDQYHKVNELLAKHHKSLTDERVLPNYKIGESMFTSGIINHNNPLNYHFDSGNYKGVWSAMFGFKRQVKGGHLACPEYDMKLEIADGSLTLFDGQAILHGVTPIRKMSKAAKRYTIVFYSLRQMWSCEEPYDELERMRKYRMEIEKKRRFKQ